MGVNTLKISNKQPVMQAKVQKNSEKTSAETFQVIRADEYKGSIADHNMVKDADLSTYTKVFGGVGAAAGSFVGNIAMPVTGGLAGAYAGGALGGLIGGPVGRVAGKIIGGLAGAYGGAKLHLKTMVGKEIGGRIGGAAGHAFGLVAKALNIPLRSDRIEETKDYSFDKMTTHLNSTSYTNHPRISKEEAKEFMSKLKAGDIVLVNDEACTIFSLLIVAVDGKADFNHALLYAGDGKTIESRTVTGGVAEGDLMDVLSHKHHAVAVRPHYDPPEKQAGDVVDAARDKIGVSYDYLFGMGDSSMYCSEVVYKSVKEGAPQIEFQKRPLITKEVVLPGDLMRTTQADVIAETGKDSTLFNSYLAKFV